MQIFLQEKKQVMGLVFWVVVFFLNYVYSIIYFSRKVAKKESPIYVFCVGDGSGEVFWRILTKMLITPGSGEDTKPN